MIRMPNNLCSNCVHVKVCGIKNGFKSYVETIINSEPTEKNKAFKVSIKCSHFIDNAHEPIRQLNKLYFIDNAYEPTVDTEEQK